MRQRLLGLGLGLATIASMAHAEAPALDATRLYHEMLRECAPSPPLPETLSRLLLRRQVTLHHAEQCKQWRVLHVSLPFDPTDPARDGYFNPLYMDALKASGSPSLALVDATRQQAISIQREKGGHLRVRLAHYAVEKAD